MDACLCRVLVLLGVNVSRLVSGIRDNLHLLEEGQGMPREELDERIARE